jgi:hypothetical protein
VLSRTKPPFWERKKTWLWDYFGQAGITDSVLITY